MAYTSFRAAHAVPRPPEELLAQWMQQQLDMAARVVHTDDVPWSLDGDRVPRLERVGGLDISFVEAPSGPGQDAGDAPAPDPDAPRSRSTPGRHGSRGSDHGDADDADGGGGGEACSGPGVAALVVLSYPDLVVQYEDYEPVDLTIPYVAGFLGFREVAAYGRLLARAERTPHAPQVLVVDGCGALHPRGCGSACQLGVTAGCASVGVAKNLLAVDGLDRWAVRGALQEAAAAAAAAGTAASTTTVASCCGSAAAADGGDPAQASPAGGGGSAVGGLAVPAGAAGAAEAACMSTHGASGAPAPSTLDDRIYPAEEAPQQQPHTSEPFADHLQQQEAQTTPPPPTAHQQSRSPAAAAASRAAPATAAAPRDVRVPLNGASGRTHGMALCPGQTRKPIYVSVGHRLSLDSAVELVRRCCLHRIPEPVRQADLRSREWLRKHGAAWHGGVDSATNH